MHGVKHFWLCERCSHVFTLTYAEGIGVELQPGIGRAASRQKNELPGAYDNGLRHSQLTLASDIIWFFHACERPPKFICCNVEQPREAGL
jgi:hypothetical protein